MVSGEGVQTSLLWVSRWEATGSAVAGLERTPPCARWGVSSVSPPPPVRWKILTVSGIGDTVTVPVLIQAIEPTLFDSYRQADRQTV